MKLPTQYRADAAIVIAWGADALAFATGLIGIETAMYVMLGSLASVGFVGVFKIWRQKKSASSRADAASDSR